MAIERVFILRNPDIRTRAQEYVGECALTEPPLEVLVRVHKSRRSLSENAKLWALYALIAEHTGHDVMEVHDAMRARFLPRRQIEVQGEPYLILWSTAKLNVSQMADYLTQLEAFCSEQGVET